MARYLVVRTSEEATDLPDRCADWAERTGAEVDVVGPVLGQQLRSTLSQVDLAGAVLDVARVVDDDALAEVIARAEFPVVAVSRGELEPEHSVVRIACAHTFQGRGTSGYLWGLWHLHALREHAPRTLTYGHEPANVADLRLPDEVDDPAVVVLVHGGFWLHQWERDLMDGLALDLTRRGYATWNVEYRRSGPSGGGWPASRDDVVRAVTSLAILSEGAVDLDRVVLLGHSAGGQLALRAASELADHPRPPVLVVSMAGLHDLRAAADEGVGWGAVQGFLGGEPGERAEAYDAASPIAHVPVGLPQLVLHGTGDEHVPYAQSERYREAATEAGDDVELFPVPDAGHFELIDPTSDAWKAVATALERRVPPT